MNSSFNDMTNPIRVLSARSWVAGPVGIARVCLGVRGKPDGDVESCLLGIAHGDPDKPSFPDVHPGI